MPNLTLDANKIVYGLLTIVVFLAGYIANSFVLNNKRIAIKQDEIAVQLLEINIQLAQIKKDILPRSEVVEIVKDELLKNGLIKNGR